MNICFELYGGMCALFYENQLGIKKSVIRLFTCIVKFREPYHSNHVIPHRVIYAIEFISMYLFSYKTRFSPL